MRQKHVYQRSQQNEGHIMVFMAMLLLGGLIFGLYGILWTLLFGIEG